MNYAAIPKGLRTGDPSNQSNPFAAMFLGFQNSIGTVGDSYSPEQDELFKITTQGRNALHAIMGPTAQFRLTDNALEKPGDLLSKIRERRDQEILRLEGMIGQFVLEMRDKPWMAEDAGRHVNGLQSGIDYVRQSFDQQETLARAGLLKAGTRFGLGALRNLGSESPATQSAIIRQVLAGRFDAQNLIGDTMGISDRAGTMGLGAFPTFEKAKVMRQLMEANLGVANQSAAYGNLSPVQTAEKQLAAYRQMLPTVTKLRTEAAQAFAKDDSLDNLRILNETNLLYEDMFNKLRDGWKEQSSGVRSLIGETDDLTLSSQAYVLSLKLANVELGALGRQLLNEATFKKQREFYENLPKYGGATFGMSPGQIQQAYRGRLFERTAKGRELAFLRGRLPGLADSYRGALGRFNANPSEENRLAADTAFKRFRDTNAEFERLRDQLNYAREAFLEFGQSVRLSLENSVGSAISNLVKGTGDLRSVLVSFADDVIDAFSRMSANSLVQSLIGDAGHRDQYGNPGDFGGLLGNLLGSVFGGAKSAQNNATGGIYSPRPGGHLVRVGEKGTEAIFPLSEPRSSVFGFNGPRHPPAGALHGSGGRSSGVTIVMVDDRAKAAAAAAKAQALRPDDVVQIVDHRVAKGLQRGGQYRRYLDR
jgi:hypothetical protein